MIQCVRGKTEEDLIHVAKKVRLGGALVVAAPPLLGGVWLGF